MLSVAVVGSGPSGVYTAQALLRQSLVPDVRVHVLDRLPTPYGLVRYGVAPDHEKIKSLQNSLRAVLEDDRVTFVGNVGVGGAEGVSPARLAELYHAVVYCVGASADRALAVPGESLPGSYSATRFVSWYSAHPDVGADPFVLDARSAVVIGVGNVAVDVARILARGADELRATDVPRAALSALEESRVRDVHIVGRRGPSQARFTTKELRELGALPGARVVVDPAELALDPAYAAPDGLPGALSLPAVVRRNLEVLRGWSAAGEPHGGRCRAPYPAAVLPAAGGTAGARRAGRRGAVRADGSGQRGRGPGHRRVRGRRGAAGPAGGRLPRGGAAGAALRPGARHGAAHGGPGAAGRGAGDRASTWRGGSSGGRPG